MNKKDRDTLHEIAKIDRDISEEGQYSDNSRFYAASVETRNFEIFDEYSPNFNMDLAEEVKEIRGGRLDGGPDDPHSKIVEAMNSNIMQNEEIAIYAHKLIDEFTEFPKGENRIGKTYSAAAIYLSCKEIGDRKTKRDIAQASNITEVTLRRGVNELKSRMEASEKQTLEDFRERLN